MKRTFSIARFAYWFPALTIGGVLATFYLVGKFQVYKIRRADGVQIKLSDALRGVPELGASVCSGVNRYLLPNALASVRAGKPVTIGAITATQQGLTRGKKTLPWAACAGLQVFRGAFVIKEQGKSRNWYTIVQRRMPNYFVLASLIDAMKSGQQPGMR